MDADCSSDLCNCHVHKRMSTACPTKIKTFVPRIYCNMTCYIWLKRKFAQKYDGVILFNPQLTVAPLKPMLKVVNSLNNSAFCLHSRIRWNIEVDQVTYDSDKTSLVSRIQSKLHSIIVLKMRPIICLIIHNYTH